MSRLFHHQQHPHVAARREQGPVKVGGQLKRSNWYARGNAWLAVKITAMVGSMTCAWLFAAWAIAGLPTAMEPGGIGFFNWFAEELLQLVLLSVIIVGQNIQAAAADKRAEQTYLDAEAILHESSQIQAHLETQDAAILGIQDHQQAQAEQLAGLIAQMTALVAAAAPKQDAAE